jgi:hypothetical protein
MASNGANAKTGAMKKTVDIRKIFDFAYLDAALGQLTSR